MGVTMHLIDKQMIARSFGQAASTYDSVAHFQRWTGERLLEKLPQIKPELILDLGCGTGFFSTHLKRLFPQSSYIGMDLSEQMAVYAQSHHAENRNWLVGDAEALPLADHSIDLVFSSLAIQWCSDLPLLMKEIKRVLKPNGCFVFSTLLDGSLKELKAAWSVLDDKQHVNDFYSFDDHQIALKSADFEIIELNEESKALSYHKLTDLMKELKKLGAHNLNSDRSTVLMGKDKLAVLIAEYEKFRQHNDILPASYQILWGVVKKA